MDLHDCGALPERPFGDVFATSQVTLRHWIRFRNEFDQAPRREAADPLGELPQETVPTDDQPGDRMHDPEFARCCTHLTNPATLAEFRMYPRGVAGRIIILTCIPLSG